MSCTVRRPLRADKPPPTRPSLAPADRPPREAASQDRRDQCRSCEWPRTPYPKSQFLSRSFESILPTSLTYILPSTRGCSPWRPAAVMGTTRRENIPAARPKHSSEFSRIDMCAPDIAELRRYSTRSPFLRLTRFHGPPPFLLDRDENSVRGTARRDQIHFTLPFDPRSGAGMLAGFPFG